jgi:hypothetical protein
MSPELTKFEKVKLHLKENKKFYAVGAGGMVAGAILTGVVKRPDVGQLLNNRASGTNLLYRSTQIVNNTVVQDMVRQGEPGRKTYWVEKGVWFPSRNAAAKAAGISLASVSKCCNGIIESVKDQHFVDGGDMV